MIVHFSKRKYKKQVRINKIFNVLFASRKVMIIMNAKLNNKCLKSLEKPQTKRNIRILCHNISNSNRKKYLKPIKIALKRELKELTS
jgi:hypothetical protein